MERRGVMRAYKQQPSTGVDACFQASLAGIDLAKCRKLTGEEHARRGGRNFTHLSREIVFTPPLPYCVGWGDFGLLILESLAEEPLIVSQAKAKILNEYWMRFLISLIHFQF